MIQTVAKKDLHLNYYFSIIKELESISNYIEFHKDNNSTFSIELAKVLFTASSEVDVVMKQICLKLNKRKSPKNIKQYREIIENSFVFHLLRDERVEIPLHGFSLKPWSNWYTADNPDWWTAYNKVKHERNDHFSQATLKNALNSVAGLLVLIIYLRALEEANPFDEIGLQCAIPRVLGKIMYDNDFFRLAEYVPVNSVRF